LQVKPTASAKKKRFFKCFFYHKAFMVEKVSAADVCGASRFCMSYVCSLAMKAGYSKYDIKKLAPSSIYRIVNSDLFFFSKVTYFGP